MTNDAAISVCSWCHSVRIGGEWVRATVDDKDKDNITHGICPSCRVEFFPAFPLRVAEVRP